MSSPPHLLLPGPWADAPILELTGPAAHHVRTVLRVRAGSPVTYTDGRGRRGDGVLIDAGVERGAEEEVPPPRPLTLAVAPPHRGERARFVVEKLTEIGATRLIWLETERVQRPPPRPEKVAAWVDAAVEQSRSAWRLEVSGPVRPGELTGTLAVAVPGAPPPVWADLAGSTVVVGPEGGLTPGDLAALGDGVTRFGLPGAILRTETAALVVAAIARYS